MMEKGVIMMMITEKMTSIMTDQNEIVSSIQKLSPKAGDVLMFYIKTDEYGTSMVDLDVVQQTANMIEKIVDKGVSIMFLMDKICLFSIEDADAAIKRLENCISYIRDATDQVPDIENGNLGDPVTIKVEEAQDPFKRVL